MDKNRVYYIWNENLINECDRIPVVLQRASLVHNLIVAYGLTNRLTVLKSKSATYEDLKEFHSELYLDHLKTLKDLDEDYIPNDQDEEFGIGYDCPPISNMYEMVCTIAGGSVTAVRSLTLGCADIAMNWCGGWHHAQRFAADGFCYINDIVIAIEKLRRRFPKVLYIDLDAHHGNGVEDAYNLSKTVFTLSFHKHETGYYPGSGAINDIGCLIGKGFACNFPFKHGYTDETLIYAFDNVFPMICDEFTPDAIVVQCGADALARDPHGGGALTCSGYVHCVRSVLDRRKPTLLLGGGGYNFPNVARLWTNLTALVLGLTLDEDIPEHDFYERYGPDYTLKIDKSLCRDENNDAHLEGCIGIIRDNLEKYLINKQKHIDGPPTKKLKTEENSN